MCNLRCSRLRDNHCKLCFVYAYANQGLLSVKERVVHFRSKRQGSKRNVNFKTLQCKAP